MYKVLIVEDEDIIRKGLRYTVKWGDLDCTVAGEARNGVEGVEAIRSLNPDIVIADITMPVKDGLEMIRDTYRDHDYASIILSGFADFEYARSAIRFGVSAYLLKPLDMNELQETVRGICRELGERRRHEEQKTEMAQSLDINLLGDAGAGGRDEVVADMLRYLQQHFSEKILMSDLEKQCHYSGAMLNRRFKAQTGMTFNEYVIRYRVTEAVRMMRDGRSVNDTAASCGFSDYKYFNTVFRKYVGYSPKEFISMLRFI